MEFLSLPGDPDAGSCFPTLQQALFETCFTLGQLSGSLRCLPEAAAPFFAYRMSRLALVRSLSASGYSSAPQLFEKWVTQSENMPAFAETAAAPSYRIFTRLLGELQAANWPPLAEAATVLRRAVPHLTQPFALSDEELEGQEAEDGLTAALEGAAAFCALPTPPGEDRHAIDQLWELVERARAMPCFSLSPRDHQLIDTPLGPRSVEVRGRKAPLWALDLHLGAALAGLRLLPFSLPIPGAISEEALNPHEEARQRQLAFFQTLRRALGEIQAAFAGALADLRAVEDAGGHFRSSSRAPLVYALVTGLGACRTRQVQDGLGASRLGVRGMLRSLEAAGLIAKDAHGAWVRTGGRPTPPAMRPAEPLPSVDTRRMDRDLAELDRILSRFS